MTFQRALVNGGIYLLELLYLVLRRQANKSSPCPGRELLFQRVLHCSHITRKEVILWFCRRIPLVSLTRPPSSCAGYHPDVPVASISCTASVLYSSTCS